MAFRRSGSIPLSSTRIRGGAAPPNGSRVYSFRFLRTPRAASPRRRQPRSFSYPPNNQKTLRAGSPATAPGRMRRGSSLHMPTFTPKELIEHATAVLVAAGTPADKAGLVAGLLVEANGAGHDSHGVIRLPQYLAGVEKKEIVPDAEVETVRQTPMMAVVEGKLGFWTGHDEPRRRTRAGQGPADGNGRGRGTPGESHRPARQLRRPDCPGGIGRNDVRERRRSTAVPHGSVGGHRAEAPHRSPRLRDSQFPGADCNRHDHDRGRRRQGQGGPQPRS